MGRGKGLKKDICEQIFEYWQGGMPSKYISQFTGVSDRSVKRVITVYNAVKADDFDKAFIESERNVKSTVLLWALNKLNKSFPEGIPMPETRQQLTIGKSKPDIPNSSTETNANEDLVRILSNIEKLLQNLCLNQASAVKEQNANHDILFNAVANLNNSVLAEMRKYKNRA